MNEKKGVKLIEDKYEKEAIATKILNDLPEWFGLPDSTREYIEKSKEYSFLAYYKGSQYVGFIVLKETGKKTAEIYVMGVLKQFHRMHIGKMLFQAFVQFANKNGYEYLQVKTVDEGHYDEYDKTRMFYEKMGFVKMECFPNLWDEWNPCLIMIQSVQNALKV